MLIAVAESARDDIRTVAAIKYLLLDFVEDDLGVSRLTATKYLDKLAEAGFLVKGKAGRSSFYRNMTLYDILTAPGMRRPV